MDFLTLIGIIIAFGAIILGQFLEGGHLSTLINGPAFLIVTGGTLGAVMVQSPLHIFIRSMNMLPWLFKTPEYPMQESLDKLLRWSNVARREGLLGLEKLAQNEPDLFSRKGLQLLVDGNEPEAVRKTMELEIIALEDRDLQAAKVFEAMGGYAPTIGIIGAVMGLIHVMGNLSDPSKLGSGIAVAFVATIYGVGTANLLLLPAANKLKSIVRDRSRHQDMLTEGLIAIAEGENPQVIALRLEAFLN
ncbi:MAG: flagellar motor protein [Gammaproteobacteria bacterium]